MPVQLHSSYFTAMTGRGRQHKTKSPDTKCAKSKNRPGDIKEVLLPRCTDFAEEKQNETSKTPKPKTMEKENHTEENPKAKMHVVRKRTPKEETTKMQRDTVEDTTKAPIKTKKVRAGGGKAKVKEALAGEANMQEEPFMEDIKPQMPNDATKGHEKTTKAKISASNSPDEFTEETTKMQPETAEDTKKAPIKTNNARAHRGKVKGKVPVVEEIKTQANDTTKAPEKTTKAKISANNSPDEFTEETTKMKPETGEDTKKAPIKTNEARACRGKVKGKVPVVEEIKTQANDTTKAPEKLKKAKITAETPEDTTKGMVEDRDAVDSTLHTTLHELKIRMKDKSNASEVVNKITKIIMEHLKKHSQHFKEVQPPLRTGSYYEHVKISNPDEFDVMFPIPVERVVIEPFGDDGAFYKVALKRGDKPLKHFEENDILSGSNMLEEFREEVKKSVKELKEWQMTKKKKGCPAVTLTTQVQSVTISFDVVLCLMVKSRWPDFTKDGFQIESWLGRKVKQEYKWQPYYLVPKYEGRGTDVRDGVLAKDVWRISFSHVEKDILRNHGSEKTCCEKNGASCCRKDCLKLLKHLLHLLKEKNPSFDKFYSYHAKTALLHACCSRTKDSEWSALNLSHCFQLLLKDFEGYLQKRLLRNFFIPSQNLLSGCTEKMCNSLADCIKEQREKGFPIFK